MFSTLAAYLGSSYVNQFNKFGRTFQVYAQADAQFRLTTRDIENLTIRNQQGAMIPLGTIATVTPAVGPPFTASITSTPVRNRYGLPSQGYSSGQSITLMEQIADQDLAAGHGL